MAHVRWHATIRLSRIPTRHTQNLTPVQGRDNSNNCLRQGSLVTAPTLPYAGAGSQQFKKLLTPGQDSDNSNANPYTCTGFQCFTRKILTLVQVPNISDHSFCLGSLPTILKMPYTTKINIV
ncbi:hypothetical protein O181_107062 [Austropuccinia psidii MF-1]|uniref:Uncharacterized protein n=1 Tax=Austropuccinia psidii MF-1 TaxID=1389203 RepID=A0A9Q3JT90_9BASI|nr:hypothetical protein [Austropuccinia psidii MF-1]